jgi:hypothetical protein
MLKHTVTEKSLIVVWTIVGLCKFTAALQPVFLNQNLVTFCIMVFENGGPLAHKITLRPGQYVFTWMFPLFSAGTQAGDGRGAHSS